jgi:hypothetical protein
MEHFPRRVPEIEEGHAIAGWRTAGIFEIPVVGRNTQNQVFCFRWHRRSFQVSLNSEAIVPNTLFQTIVVEFSDTTKGGLALA